MARVDGGGEKSISVQVKICYFISVLLRVPFSSKHFLSNYC